MIDPIVPVTNLMAICLFFMMLFSSGNKTTISLEKDKKHKIKGQMRWNVRAKAKAVKQTKLDFHLDASSEKLSS